MNFGKYDHLETNNKEKLKKYLQGVVEGRRVGCNLKVYCKSSQLKQKKVIFLKANLAKVYKTGYECSNKEHASKFECLDNDAKVNWFHLQDFLQILHFISIFSKVNFTWLLCLNYLLFMSFFFPSCKGLFLCLALFPPVRLQTTGYLFLQFLKFIG